MQRLILMRHAKTEAWYEGVDDHGRALTERGHVDALRVAEALVVDGWRADLALVSTARRARETWLEMAAVHRAREVQYLDDLYLASPDTMSELIEPYAGSCETLILIGHNPGIYDFAWQLTRRAGSDNPLAVDHLREKYPTGCASLFEAAEDGPFVPVLFKLVDVVRPKDLRPGEEGP